MDDTVSGIGAYLKAYSRLADLNLSEERLKELEPECAALFADMRKLWAIPIGQTEAAIGFYVDRQGENA